ncbi:alpha/beta hydrolase domain-containing protein [Actinomadura sp. KC345]|uniref:alpha/beta hydrolase domain-containing protein n=1 Tax=Actinomadura sp. KC345 TaxID=2530371 RepID=UPI001FB5979F|nr:alpha/beta hydrolase domain-containing protein [Actinomadura sp. KC345]
MRNLPVTRLLVAALVAVGLAAAPGTAQAGTAPGTVVQGPIPGAPPGDPSSPNVEDTYPWMATNVDLASRGYVEREFFVSGEASAYSATGERLATGVPYKTRVIVRKPTRPSRFNGTAIAEWQNVTAGYDLDALWSTDQITRDGNVWAGISAQRVGVEHLVEWSPARYGDLDVTGGGRFTDDELSYDIFAQVAETLRERGPSAPLGGLKADTVIGAGASQSASRMTAYYDAVLLQSEKVFDGYAFIVGPAPARRGPEPVFQVLSETDVRSSARPPDTETFRRWEVAGTAHSGWHGQDYRRPILNRDLGEAPTYRCDRPAFSRVPLHHVIATAYAHLVRWTKAGTPPPSAPPLRLNPDGTKVRDSLGLAKGGIRLSQVEAPTALNTGDNSGETFCFLFGTHVPFDEARLDSLYPSHGRYVAAVVKADVHNLRDGYLLPADARQNRIDAIGSGVGGH